VFEAACDGDTRRVLQYLDRGMAINRVDKAGNTLLHWASEYGHTSLVSQLLARGADASAQDKVWPTSALLDLAQHGYSPLDVAQSSYRFYATSLSVSEGADQGHELPEAAPPHLLDSRQSQEYCIAQLQRYLVPFPGTLPSSRSLPPSLPPSLLCLSTTIDTEELGSPLPPLQTSSVSALRAASQPLLTL
jgi:hypothetical protein